MSQLLSNPSHGQGQTCLAFTPDGLYAFTGGQDCIVRIWDMAAGTDQEPMTAPDADKGVTTISASEKTWVSGSEDSEVRYYPHKERDLGGLITSVNGVPVRCVAIDPQGKKVAVASDELSIKVVELEDIMQIRLLEGHTRGVRRLTWHPSGTLVTSCGSDGKIIIWDLSQDPPKIVKTIEGAIPSVIDAESTEFMYDCSAVWHPSGDRFYVATRNHEIVSISRTNWTKTSSFVDKDVTGAVTALAISINGVYIATAVQSKVYIWSTQTRRVLVSQAGTPGATITQIAFSPTQNIVAWIDSEGVLNRWLKAIPISYPDPIQSSFATSTPATVPVTKAPAPTLFGDDPSDVDRALEGGAGEVNLDGVDGIDDDWIIDDVGIAMQDDDDKGRDTKDGYVKEMVSITKAQPPFQPGATPMENKKRFLAFSMLGVIDVTDQDEYHIVNVDFFDRSTRKSYHFTDHFKYDLGCLGERGALFACPPENDHPAQVLYKPHGTWTTQGEWTYLLKRKGTKVIGVAAGGTTPLRTLREDTDNDLEGSGNVVIATSEGDLTFLSGTGRERRILGLGGDFVSMTAGAEWVFVVHRAGSTTIDGSQNLSYSMINFDDFGVRQRDFLPIPKGHQLKWIGITAEGAPAIYDTTGCLHILSKFRVPHHGSWTRILDTNLFERRQGKDESYWPVGVTENTLMCLILKGRQGHPVFPRPLVQELPIIMPFRREEPAEEQIQRKLLFIDMTYDLLEDELTTNELRQRELAVDKELIQLIQLACKNDNIPRVIELCKLLHLPNSLDAAVKIAQFYHLIGLKERIEMLKLVREQNEDRLVTARDKRMQWTKRDPPPRRILETDVSLSHQQKLFQDSAPPRALPRPGLTPATIDVESTRYTSAAPRSTLVPPTSSWDDSFSTQEQSSISPDGKRKRDDDELMTDSCEMPAPPPKQKSNPFAKKVESGRNPFARRQDVNKTIEKSESFFDKVEAVEKSTGKTKRPVDKGKEKAKKEGPKQQTLFGLMGVKSNKAKPSRSPDPDAQNETQTTESQSTDIVMDDATQESIAGSYEEPHSNGLEETQLTEESQETQAEA